MKKQDPFPPRVFVKLFRWYCHPGIVDYIEGDLLEVYYKRVNESGKRKADLGFLVDVLLLFRPGIIRPKRRYQNLNTTSMFKTYFKIGWRNLLKNKGYSIINTGGFALGMTVAILIGLWMYDELTFDSSHSNHDRIAQVMHLESANNQIATSRSNPVVLGDELRNTYGGDFKYVIHARWTDAYMLSYGDKIFQPTGNYFDPQVADMLSLEMIAGSRDGLKNMNSILLSESVAKSYFGSENPIGKTMRLDDRTDVQVAGVYEDIAANSTFNDLKFIMSWELFMSENTWINEMPDPWANNICQIFVQIADNTDIQKVSAKVSDVMINHVSESGKRYNPVVILHPMAKWHLYSSFKNGVDSGGQIENVWLFGIAGVFVLLLACINFMNLSTAQSEKRSKEVGIRKSIGSARSQLIMQFFTESVMVSVCAFLLALLIAALILPSFNEIAAKKISMPLSQPVLWFACLGFSILTGLIAGLYPAMFLSSFQPVKVLKGAFMTGAHGALPRKALVIIQFTISITLIIGTLVVYKQIQYAQNRPVGYSRDGLISVELNPERKKHFEAIRSELQNDGTIIEMAQSGSPITDVRAINAAFNWEGKDPAQTVHFPNNAVNHEYGKAIGWEIKEGRDFSRDFASDSSAFILNESAAKFIGFEDPIGKTIRWKRKPFTVIGVVKDLLVQSPYNPVQPSLFHVSTNKTNVALIRIDPEVNIHDALAKTEAVFKKYNPTFPFSATFVDAEYDRKFGNEKRIGKLALFFAVIAVAISCLGLFGLASFVAERRTKEIGIRKVMGASVANLWQMLSREFIILVVLSCMISIPLAYYYLNSWLQNYDYRTTIPWWIFAMSCIGSLMITLLTVSFRAIKAAMLNPVKSLRSE
jgi:ABC-type antimicrobial peptide transport system permease subunit